MSKYRPCDIRGGAYGTIDIKGKFSNRLKKLYDYWKDDKNAPLWHNSDVLVIETSPSSKYYRSSKSSALNVWLFGIEFPNTTIIFGKKRIHYLCNDQDLIILLKEATYDSAKAMSDPTTKDRDRNAQIKQIEKICMSVRNSVRNRAGQDKTTVVGHIRESLLGVSINGFLELIQTI